MVCNCEGGVVYYGPKYTNEHLTTNRHARAHRSHGLDPVYRFTWHRIFDCHNVPIAHALIEFTSHAGCYGCEPIKGI